MNHDHDHDHDRARAVGPADPISRPADGAPSRRVRRALLAGGVVIAAASAAGAWRAVATGMLLQGDEAFHPWAAWGDTRPGDPLSLVAAAVLAANPHNTQPWLFKVTAERIEVRQDASRTLGAMDPFGREMWHGLGAAIANIEIAAPARGFDTETVLLPDASDPSCAAHVLLRAREPQAAALAHAIERRRTNRANYEAQRPVPLGVRQRISELDDGVVRTRWMAADSDRGKRFADLTLAGTQRITADREMAEAGHHWFRANPREVARHRDGVAVPTSGIAPLVATLSPLVRPVDSAEAGRHWLRSTERQLASAPLFGLILVRDRYDRRAQLLAGARWQRIHLMLTQSGLAAQPMNQLVEIVDRDRQLSRPSPTAAALADLGGDADWQATFAFRAGYATRDVPRSARRPASAVVIV